MGVLGVVLCEVLELEFADLLGADPEVTRVTVVENDQSARLIEAFEVGGVGKLHRISRVDGFTPNGGSEFEVLVCVLELALHSRKKTLQEGVVEAAREIGSRADALLLGYGLCGNALEHPEALLADAGVPIFIPVDEDHPVDDCVGMVIGGREAYYGEQCKVAGTFFMTPGWTFHWKRIFDKEFGGMSPEMARKLFAGYERSLLLSTPLMSEDEMRRNAADFNELFDCRSELRRGTLKILEDSWLAAKQCVKASTQPDLTASAVAGR
jgi:hypothetical protein